MMALLWGCATPGPLPFAVPLTVDRSNPVIEIRPAFGNDGLRTWVSSERDVVYLSRPSAAPTEMWTGLPTLTIGVHGGATVAWRKALARELCFLPQPSCAPFDGTGRLVLTRSPNEFVVWNPSTTPVAWHQNLDGAFVPTTLPTEVANATLWTPTSSGLFILNNEALQLWSWRKGGTLELMSESPPSPRQPVFRSLTNVGLGIGWLVADAYGTAWMDGTTRASRPLDVRVDVQTIGYPIIDQIAATENAIAVIASDGVISIGRSSEHRLQVFAHGPKAWVDWPMARGFELAVAQCEVRFGLSDASWTFASQRAIGWAERPGRFFVPGSLDHLSVESCNRGPVLRWSDFWARPLANGVELGRGTCPSHPAPHGESRPVAFAAPSRGQLARACTGDLVRDGNGNPFVCLLGPEITQDGATWGQFARPN